MQLSVKTPTPSRKPKNAPAAIGPDDIPSFVIYYTFSDVKDNKIKVKEIKYIKKNINDGNDSKSNTPKKQKNTEQHQNNFESAKAAAVLISDPCIDKEKPTKSQSFAVPKVNTKANHKVKFNPPEEVMASNSTTSVKRSITTTATTSIVPTPTNDSTSSIKTNNAINNKPIEDTQQIKKTRKSTKQNWYNEISSVDDNSLFGAVFMVDSNMSSKHVGGTDNTTTNDNNNKYNDDNSKQLLDPNIDTNILNMLCEMSNADNKGNTTIDNNNTLSKTNIETSKSRSLRKSTTNKKEQPNTNDNKPISMTNPDDCKSNKILRLFEFIEKKEGGATDNADSHVAKENSPSPCSVTTLSTSPDSKNVNDGVNNINKKRNLDDISNINTNVTMNKRTKAEVGQSVFPTFTSIPHTVNSNVVNKQPRNPNIRRIRPTFLAPLSERHRFIVM